MTVGILLFSLVGCSKTLDPDDYTLEEHIEFITQKVQQRYMKEDYPYTSFAVYPLYDENNKNTHFLVEFEPYGFLMLQMHKQETSPFEYTSMYSRCDKYLCDQYNGKCGWQRYRYGTENEQKDIIEGIKWKDIILRIFIGFPTSYHRLSTKIQKTEKLNFILVVISHL